MKHVTNILLSVFVISFAGCHTLEVKRVTYDSNGEQTAEDRKSLIDNDEIVYFLPKTVLELDVPITIKTTTYRDAGVLRKDLVEEKAFAAPGIKISSKLESDDRFPLKINTKKLLNSGWVDSEFTIGLNEKGLLGTMNSKSTDVTAKTIKSVVSTAVKAIEMAAVVGKFRVKAIEITDPTVSQTIDELKSKSKDRREKVENLIDRTLDDIQGKTDLNKRKLLVAELTALRGQLKAEVEAYRPEYKESISTHTLYFEPKWSINHNDIDKETLKGKIHLPNEKTIGVTLKLTKGVNSIAGKPVVLLDAAFAKESLISELLGINYVEDGLLYRVPVPFDVEVIVDNQPLLKDTITLTQFGPIAKIPVHWKFMGQCETSGNFYDATGALKEFKIVTTNQSDDNSKDIQASLDSIKQLIELQKKSSEVQSPAKDDNNENR
jgi:hypothetical protein